MDGWMVDNFVKSNTTCVLFYFVLFCFVLLRFVFGTKQHEHIPHISTNASQNTFFDTHIPVSIHFVSYATLCLCVAEIQTQKCSWTMYRSYLLTMERHHPSECTFGYKILASKRLLSFHIA